VAAPFRLRRALQTFMSRKRHHESFFSAQRCLPWLSRQSQGDSYVTSGAATAVRQKSPTAIAKLTARIDVPGHSTLSLPCGEQKDILILKADADKPNCGFACRKLSKGCSRFEDDEAQISNGEHPLLWCATRPFVIGQ
jgi:hypothetical protein